MNYQRLDIVDETTELFFINGLKLKIIQRSRLARYLNLASLLKVFMFEPFYVAFQQLPTLQISSILAIQLLVTVWTFYCSLVLKSHASWFDGIANITIEASILVFLTIGLMFHASDGQSKVMTNLNSSAQLVGIVVICLASLMSFLELVVQIVRSLKNSIRNRKLAKV